MSRQKQLGGKYSEKNGSKLKWIMPRSRVCGPKLPVKDQIKTSPSRYQRALSRASNSVPSETNSKLYQKSGPLLPDKPEEVNIIIISDSYIGAKENKSQMTVQSPTTRKVSIMDDSVETVLESLHSFNDEMSVSILGDDSKCLQDSNLNTLSNSSQASSRSSEPSNVSSKKADPWYRKFKKWITKNLQKLKMKKKTESKTDQNSGESQKSEIKPKFHRQPIVPKSET